VDFTIGINKLRARKDSIWCNNRLVMEKAVKELTLPIEPDLVYPLLRGGEAKKWFAKPNLYIIFKEEDIGGFERRECCAVYKTNSIHFSLWMDVRVYPLRPELNGVLNRSHLPVIRAEQLAIVKYETLVHLML